MKAFAPILSVLLNIGVAMAGGDYVKGTVSEFSGTNGIYSFRFEQTERLPDLKPGCRAFLVSVRYSRVPWYSWLPFVRTSHPTLQQTDAAAAFLQTAARSHHPVNFGYMGFGLLPTGQQCVFQSKGLLLITDKSEHAVLAFSDPT